ncbi:hypothetical protein BJX65DRAFT_310798 [Aspergillus insuetus]
MPVTDRDSFVVADDPAVAPWVDTGITLDPEDLIQDNSGWRDWALEGSVNDLINVSSSQIPAWSNVGHRSVFDMPPVSDGMLLQDLGGTEFLNAYSDPVHHSPNSGLPAPSVRSLDKLDGFSSQYFGLSGESDPYLLRHFRFLSDGQTQFFKVHFRSLAAQSESENSTRPPVQFMVSSDELGNAMKSETTFGDSPRSGSARQALDDIVGPEDGRRLVGLFLRYFCHYDPVLCVSNVYTKPPTDQLWKLALEEILREIHTPHLGVLQAVLLYLQKPQVEMSGAVADSPFRWSFMSTAVALSSTLGLHLDCRDWPIPSWERRLRRRLWWAVYSESAWRSLLMGFPNPIHDDHWAVGALDETDFIIDDHCINDNRAAETRPTEGNEGDADLSKYDFVYLAHLACIASDIYWQFYTLKATSRLANDLTLSLSVAKPLRTRLNEWYSALPDQYKLTQDTTSSPQRNSSSLKTAAYLRLSYLTLELFIYRALLRPIGSTVTPHRVSELQSVVRQATAHPVAQQDGGMDAAIEATYIAAEGCASLIVSVTGLLFYNVELHGHSSAPSAVPGTRGNREEAG